MAAMPVGALAGIFVYLGRGHVALSLTATGLTTLASLFTTTLVLHVFGSGQLPGDFTMPLGRLLVEFSVCLLLPLIVAMALSRYAPKRSAAVGRWCLRGSMLTLTTLIVGSLLSGRLQIAAYGWRPPAAIGAFALGTFLVCLAAGWLARLPVAESFTVGVLSTIRNGNLGLLLKASLFPAVASASPMATMTLYVVLLYSGASLLVSGAAVLARRAAQRMAKGRLSSAAVSPTLGEHYGRALPSG
jgi:BASS family bile acid:Na+ symporter